MITPESVSPAPDTEALRQQAAAILYRHRPLPRDADALDDEAADFYAELVSRVVYAPVLAGLRSDLDQARTERDILDKALQDARKIAATYRHLLETRRGAGARTIPDDATERPENAAFLRWCEWPDCLRSFDVRTGPSEADGKGWIYVRTGMHVLLCPDHANAGHRPQRFEWEPGDTTIRTSCECEARSGDLTPTNHATCMEWWRTHVLGATPTTDPAPAEPGELGCWVRWLCDAYEPAKVAAAVAAVADPAPAAADGLREEYAGFLHPAWPDPLHFQYGDDPRANAARWYAEHVEQQPQIEVRRRVISDWVRVDVTSPAAPQAPAQPTEAFRHHDLVFNPVTRVSARDTATGHSGALLNVEDFGPAAREDTAPPNPARCAGCNAADEFWCSCPDGYTPTGEYGENVIVRNLAKPDPAPAVDGDTRIRPEEA